jgi:hypothetical protein
MGRFNPGFMALQPITCSVRQWLKAELLSKDSNRHSKKPGQPDSFSDEKGGKRI